MIKKLFERLRSSFTAAMSFTLILSIVIIIMVYAVVKYIFLLSSSETASEATIVSSRNMALQTAEDFASAHTSLLTPLSGSQAIKQWLINSTGRSIVHNLLSENNSGYASHIWCIREADGEFLSDGISGTVTLEQEEWYSYYCSGGKKYSCVYTRKCPISGEEGLLTIVPVSENGNLIGFVGSETTFAVIGSYFDKFTFPQNCCMAIADRYGSVLYSPRVRSDYADPARIAAIAEGIFRKNEYEFSNTSYIIAPETGWEVIILYDSDKEFSSTMTLLRSELLLLAALLTIMVIAVISIVKYECREIPAISRSIGEISSGNYNFRIGSDSTNEIGMIACAVDELAQDLQDKNALIDDYSNLDMLTGLKNRMKMYENIDDLIACRTDDNSRGFAVVMIDIDNLRWINEVFGHKYGDQVLKEFSAKLKNIFRRIYRFGSDEFVALTELDKYNSNPVEKLMSRLRYDLEEPMQVFAVNLQIKCSAGVTVFPDDGDSADILLRNADIALSLAKNRGRNYTNYYSSALRKSIVNKSTIAQKLSTALRNNEFFLNYQPIISIGDGSIHGFEVLLRWESDELGFVPPSKFVNIAEETGAIVDIGMWIFETACRFLKKLSEYKPDIVMSINVSPRQLEKKGYIADIRRVLEITNVDPANIQVEITESLMLDFVSRQDKVVREITDLGIGIALDDFGTGYSNFTYLKDLPVNCLKVDKSFVDEITNRTKDYMITDSIIDMMHEMGIKTVAEGVETVAQYNSLAEMNCDYIQGFLMSKPMSENAALDFVRQYDMMYRPNRYQMEKTEKLLAAEREGRST